MAKYLFHFLIILLISFTGCTLLSEKSDPDPGSRSYTWTVEAVDGPLGLIYDVWGTDLESLWVASTSGFWNYNGEEWKEVEENQEFHCGTFQSIFGFAKDDIWLGCNDGRIHYYDGTSWEPSFRFEKEEFYLSSVDGIWGTSSEDMYATGHLVYKDTEGIYSFLLHYDGRRWQEVLITDFEAQFQRVRKKNKIYLSGIKEGPSQGGSKDSLVVYSENSKGLNQEFIESRGGTLRMNSVNDKVYVVKEDALYRLNKSGFAEVIKLTGSKEVYDVLGRHKNDLILMTKQGLLHYNGQNLEYIFDIEPDSFRGYRALVLEDEIIVLLQSQDGDWWEIHRGVVNK